MKERIQQRALDCLLGYVEVSPLHNTKKIFLVIADLCNPLEGYPYNKIMYVEVQKSKYIFQLRFGKY